MMTEFQKLLITLMFKHGSNQTASTTELGWWSKKGRVAVSSAMRSLEKKGLAGYFRSGDDQWAAQCWFLTKAGKELMGVRLIDGKEVLGV